MQLKYKHLSKGETFMFPANATRAGGGPFQKLNDSAYLDLKDNRTRRIASISTPVERIPWQPRRRAYNGLDRTNCLTVCHSTDPNFSPENIEQLSDPRNEDDYDTWVYGTEPLPHDITWKLTQRTPWNDAY